MCCLRPTANMPKQDHDPNTAVLQTCCTTGIEAFLQAAQLRWIGHVIRMDDTRIPKMAFYWQIEDGARSLGTPRKRLKNTLKSNLKAWSIPLEQLKLLLQNRTNWRARCMDDISKLRHVASTYTRKNVDSAKKNSRLQQGLPL